MFRGLLGGLPRKLGWTLVILIALATIFGSQVWYIVGHDIHGVLQGITNLGHGASGHQTMGWVVASAALLVLAVLGYRKSVDKAEDWSNARSARKFAGFQDRMREAEHYRQAQAAAHRENEVMARWDRVARHAKRDMKSNNAKRRSRGQVAHEEANKHMKNELKIVHDRARSTKVHPHTGENHGGIRRK